MWMETKCACILQVTIAMLHSFMLASKTINISALPACMDILLSIQISNLVENILMPGVNNWEPLLELQQASSSSLAQALFGLCGLRANVPAYSRLPWQCRIVLCYRHR